MSFSILIIFIFIRVFLLIEWEEWGNPNERDAYDLIRSYSPMENIKPVQYPPVMLQAGLFDYRVGYWEVAKFAQRLREVSRDAGLVLFQCELDEGHTRAMDRYKYIREKAFDICFVLFCLGKLEDLKI